MNATGLTWFLNYKLGIQKVIFRSFRRNFLRTAAIMSSDSFVSKAGLDPLGIYQTVPSQYLEIGNVLPFGSYQTSNHLIDGFESHYIARLIELLK
nr:MAG TPA: RNA polymerase [Caudoviricetes sp.]